MKRAGGHRKIGTPNAIGRHLRAGNPCDPGARLRQLFDRRIGTMT